MWKTVYITHKSIYLHLHKNWKFPSVISKIYAFSFKIYTRISLIWVALRVLRFFFISINESSTLKCYTISDIIDSNQTWVFAIFENCFHYRVWCFTGKGLTFWNSGILTLFTAFENIISFDKLIFLQTLSN